MDFRLTAEQELLRRSVREFAEAEIRPHALAWDEAQHFPVELVPKLAAMGLMGIQVPAEYGGAGMSTLDYCICMEELARVCPGVALSIAAHNGLCVAHILRAGTEDQKRRFLPALVDGSMIGAWGLTEASSGSDAANMATNAFFDGAQWVINGAKVFITHGRVGHLIVAMAVTSRARGSKGVSAFIVEKSAPGIRAGKKENKLGMRASDTSEVVFDGCRVPPEQLLGSEGQGFVDAMAVLDAGRIGIAALAVGLAQGAHDAALQYAQQRIAFGTPISSFQAVQFKLADGATQIEAARMLTYRAACAKDNREPITLAASMAKLFASEVAVRVADDGVQIHGGYGFVKDYPAEKYFRDVKLLTIGEGTSEIQRLVIARQLTRTPTAVA
jgi:alkylation response protein AidB-like acyl-CoA dehydrogenase